MNVRRRRWPNPGPNVVTSRAAVSVRFQEVDSLSVVWHGHYLTYFEEGRLAFGREHGLDYRSILEAGYVAPIVHAEVDYFAPARFGDTLAVECRLHQTEGARIVSTYRVAGAHGERLASGLTVQVFTDLEGEPILVIPEFYETFLDGCEWSVVDDSAPIDTGIPSIDTGTSAVDTEGTP